MTTYYITPGLYLKNLKGVGRQRGKVCGKKIAIASNLGHEIFDCAAVSKLTTGSGSLLGIIFPSLRSGGGK